MIAQFADAVYYIALLNRDDTYHANAVALTRELRGEIVTTEWVLAEVGNAFAQARHRSQFIELVRVLRVKPDVRIIPASRESFDKGLHLFSRRPDKNWSLIDCISFTVMEDLGIREALTTDRHFVQAGFVVLLK